MSMTFSSRGSFGYKTRGIALGLRALLSTLLLRDPWLTDRYFQICPMLTRWKKG